MAAGRLLVVVARRRWHWRPWQLVLAAVTFGGIELSFLGANLAASSELQGLARAAVRRYGRA